MKYGFKIMFFIFYLFCSVCFASKLAFLDFNLVLQNSNKYQNFVKNINIEANNNYLKFNNKINKLVEEEKDLQDKVSLIDEKKFQLLKDNLNIRKLKILNEIKKIEDNLNKKNVYMYNLFFSKISNIVKNICKIKKYDIVLEKNSIIYNNKNIYDITPMVIKKLNI